MKNFLFLITVTLLLLLTSCQKNEVIDALDVTVENSQAPTIEKGTYKFQDINHFESYYTQLNTLYDDNEDAFDQLRKQNNAELTVYGKLMDPSIIDLEGMKELFLIDPIMMSIVNEHFEFQIADVLLTVVSNEFLLTSKVNNQSTRDQLRQLKKGDEFNPNNLPRETYLISDQKFDGILSPWDGTPYTFSLEDYENDMRHPCIPEEAGQIDWEINGDRILVYVTRVYYSWLSFTYEEAYCVSGRWINGDWEEHDANTLTAHVWAFRNNNLGDGCTNAGWEDEDNTCSNCNEERARVNRSGIWAHSSVTSQFIMQWDNNNAQRTIFADHNIVF